MRACVRVCRSQAADCCRPCCLLSILHDRSHPVVKLDDLFALLGGHQRLVLGKARHGLLDAAQQLARPHDRARYGRCIARRGRLGLVRLVLRLHRLQVARIVLEDDLRSGVAAAAARALCQHLNEPRVRTARVLCACASRSACSSCGCSKGCSVARVACAAGWAGMSAPSAHLVLGVQLLLERLVLQDGAELCQQVERRLCAGDGLERARDERLRPAAVPVGHVRRRSQRRRMQRQRRRGMHRRRASAATQQDSNAARQHSGSARRQTCTSHPPAGTSPGRGC